MAKFGRGALGFSSILIVLLLGTTVSVAQSRAGQNLAAVTRAPKVNVFAGPGDNYPYLASYSPNLRLELVGRSQDWNWLAIIIPPDQPGWVFATDLEIQGDRNSLVVLTPPPTPVPTPQPAIKLVIEYGNLRIGCTKPSNGVCANNPYADIIVDTHIPFQKVTFAITSISGNYTIKSGVQTNNRGIAICRVWLDGLENGDYRIVATAPTGESAATIIKVDRTAKDTSQPFANHCAY